MQLKRNIIGLIGGWMLLLCCSVQVLGQSKKIWLEQGDEYFAGEDYASALEYYHKVLDDTTILKVMIFPYEVQLTNQKLKDIDKELDSNRVVPIKDYIHHQIAMCYRNTYDYGNALSHFAETADFASYPEDVYFYGEALMKMEAYEEAIEQFELFIKNDRKIDSLTTAAQLSMTGSYYAMRDDNIIKAVEINKMDTNVFNKGTASLAAQYWGSDKKIIFTSAREGGVILDPVKQQSEFLLDIYWTEQVDDTTWGVPHNFGRPVNTARHEAAGCFNNSNVMFFTKWSDNDRLNQHIFLARMVNTKFFEAMALDTTVNVEGYKSVQPFVSMDGSTLYFSSNRPGGFGGMDLWKVYIDPSGMPASEAINLGQSINSKFDEVTPFFHESSSTLFFSSDGHQSIGGLDVFKSYYDRKSETFSEVKNLGMPINSSQDDAYLIWDSKLEYGYMSSDREPCEGGHCYDIYSIKNAPIKIILEGYVFDFDTDLEIPGAKITFKDVRFGFEPFEIISDETGFYSLELQRDWEMFIKAQKESYFADAASVDATVITETTVLVQDFYLQKIPEGEIEIEGIEYDFDSDKLRDISMEVLDKLFDFLEVNDNLYIEINSHTDARGSDKYNLDLSQRRAKSCVDYLIEKGISKDRLKPIGYGETQPAILKGDDKKEVLDEEGKPVILTEAYIDGQKGIDFRKSLHQKNRRTAFKVVGEGFKIKSK
jgi:OOP family OmpA-OmpF porin